MTELVGTFTNVEFALPTKPKLAMDGGPQAIKHPIPPMYPGGMRIGAEEEKAVLDVLRSKRLFRYYGPYSGGSKVDEFEKAFAAYMKTGHAVAVSSGSASLVCGLAALGLGPGDEVIIPAYTWIASAGAVMAVGAVPILAEIDQSLTLDVADVESKITGRTKVIMPVHMRGAPCQMHRIAGLAQSRGLKILEDVAQAAGGSFCGQLLGSIGDVGAFSFQFNKIITCGEGGIAITNDAELYQRIVMYHDVVGGLRNRIPKEKILNGLNFRMSELHGAIMLVQLCRLDGLLTDLRRRKATLKSAIQDVAKRKGVLLQNNKRCRRRYSYISRVLRANGGTRFPNCRGSQCRGSQCIRDLPTPSRGLPRLCALDTGHGEAHLVREWRTVAVAWWRCQI